MADKRAALRVAVDELRPAIAAQSLGFALTDDIEALDRIIGQDRAVEAIRFGIGIPHKGYNIFVTGPRRTGRLEILQRLLEELKDDSKVPCDLCYVNNFKDEQSPLLLRFDAGKGAAFKKDVHEFIEFLKKDLPALFESEEYIARKNSIAEAHERSVRDFFKAVEEKVKDTGLVVVRMQMGPVWRPDLLPLVDEEPKRFLELEEMVERGRFSKEEYERLKAKRDELKEELDQVVAKVRVLQKDVAKKLDEVDKDMFLNLAKDTLDQLQESYPDPKVAKWLDSVLQHMVENLDGVKMLGAPAQGQQMPMPMMQVSPEVLTRPYEVNLLVDNSEQSGPPVIFESYPTYRNLFGSIERVMDRMGGWRTDFSQIKVGSFVKANGGYLVLDLMDAIVEPGVWQTLKRSLKTKVIEIETYDPSYFFTSTGLKPEPISMDVKGVVVADPYLYTLLQMHDPDTAEIFKVRADFSPDMEKNDKNLAFFAGFVKKEVEKKGLKPFEASAVAAVMEEAVRAAGRQEKISIAFPMLSDLLVDADSFAQEAKSVAAEHVRQAVEARIHRSNMTEERIQEMIDRGSLFVDVEGEEVGQVNGLAVYSLGDYSFGKPSRITASTSMGKEGIINIEREADMSGPTHNKGMLILSGWLRQNFARTKPLTLAASIAFEQSYGGVDGDSASSTELYAVLSSLSEVPIRQNIAVTGSVNQRGEVQPIGGVNQKIEGFYLCCKHKGLSGEQGVMIPRANVKDLMLRHDVVQAVEEGKFNVWAVETIEEGIEILTGLPAGERGDDGAFPDGSVYRLVDDKLTALAVGLRDFAKAADEDKK
jgi:lon-related putative ATP-dependent protease